MDTVGAGLGPLPPSIASLETRLGAASGYAIAPLMEITCPEI